MSTPEDCTCTCYAPSIAIHWLRQDDGRLGCHVVGCACTVAPTAICSSCGEGFAPPARHPDTRICYPCSEAAIRSDVDRRFAPLINALRARGFEPDDEPWNTGGGIMCWALPLPRVEAHGLREEPYLLFSDEAEVLGCGLYLTSDSTGIMLEPQGVGAYMDGDHGYPEKGWATSRDGKSLGRFTADWLASIYPAILDWMLTIEWSTDDDDLVPTYPPLTLPGTSITDYDAG